MIKDRVRPDSSNRNIKFLWITIKNKSLYWKLETIKRTRGATGVSCSRLAIKPDGLDLEHIHLQEIQKKCTSNM
jgi:hypothetical protein